MNWLYKKKVSFHFSFFFYDDWLFLLINFWQKYKNVLIYIKYSEFIILT
jgi:hypothetical protein